MFFLELIFYTVNIALKLALNRKFEIVNQNFLAVFPICVKMAKAIVFFIFFLNSTSHYDHFDIKNIDSFPMECIAKIVTSKRPESDRRL